MATSPDPTREQLQAFLAGGLSAAEQDDPCAHVEQCARCQSVLEDLVAGNEAAEWTAWRRSGGDPGPAALFLERLRNSRAPEGWAAPRGFLVVEPGGVVDQVEHRGQKRTPEISGYQILGELGRGGMGVVYLARQLRLNRSCALKMILAAEHAGPAVLDRFLGEAEAIARLKHPNVVQVYGAGDHDGHPYLELEFVEGGSVAQALQGAPWPPRRAAALVEPLARAMAESHLLGVVHPDLKPANVPVPPSRLVPGLPRDIDTVCLNCLEKDPQRRYAGAAELADDLARYQGGQPIHARPVGVAARLVRWAHQHRGLAASLALTMLLLSASAVGSLIAAADFKQMEGEQRQLAHRNGALARENEVQRRRAEQASAQARASQRAAELMLADMNTEHSLQAAEFGRYREAVLWFAKAAQVATSDRWWQEANLIRTRAWSRQVWRPIAVLIHPGGVSLSLTFHLDGAHLLSTSAPYPRSTVLWDVRSEQPLNLPGDSTATATTAAWSTGGEGP